MENCRVYSILMQTMVGGLVLYLVFLMFCGFNDSLEFSLCKYGEKFGNGSQFDEHMFFKLGLKHWISVDMYCTTPLELDSNCL